MSLEEHLAAYKNKDILKHYQLSSLYKGSNNNYSLENSNPVYARKYRNNVGYYL